MSFFGTYTFLSLNISPSSSLHSLSLNIFTPTCFISSTTFITLSSLASDSLIFLIRSTPLITTSVVYIALTSNYSFFTNTLSSLSLSTPICQSGHLLRLLALPILLPGTCFNIKSNLDRYKTHCACLLFNFWLLMKYSRFLWLLQISNLVHVPSSKCLHSSRHWIITNISLSWIS